MSSPNDGDLEKYFEEGARKLSTVDVGRASHAGSSKFDKDYWKIRGTSHKAHVLAPKNPKKSAEAVLQIFKHPDKWRFDCSEWIQVLSHYAWLKVLGRDEFNRRVQTRPRGLEIKPFHSSVFTIRKHYYRREKKWQEMLYYPNGEMARGYVTGLTDAEILASAPVGTRVGFKSEVGQGATAYENTLKIGKNRFAAHWLQGEDDYKTVFDLEELLRRIYTMDGDQDEDDPISWIRDKVWIREIAFFRGMPGGVPLPKPSPLSASGA